VYAQLGAQERAFVEAVTYLNRRIDLLLSIPFETLERRALEAGLNTSRTKFRSRTAPRRIDRCDTR
jgi:hypothetical protein